MALTGIETDYLALYPAIIERLIEKIPEVAGSVHRAYELADVLSGTTLPAVGQSIYVLYDGDDLGDYGDSATTRILQRWLVVICIRNIAPRVSTQGIPQDAGPLILRCLQALCGWIPFPESRKFGVLLRRGGYRAYYRPGGLGFFPYLFYVQVRPPINYESEIEGF